MTDTPVMPPAPPRRIRFDLLPWVIVQPRRAFEEIAGLKGGGWVAPMLVLTVAAAVLVIATRAVTPLPDMAVPVEGFTPTPEQEAQMVQAAQMASSPIFTVLSVIGQGISLWLSWLVLGGVLHLALTLMGGRGGVGRSMGLAAWAMIPFSVRDVVRIVATLVASQPILAPGISGFAPADAAGVLLLVAALMRQIDLFVVWHIALLIIGAHALDSSLPRVRAAVVLTVLVAILLLIWSVPTFLSGLAGTMLGGDI